MTTLKVGAAGGTSGGATEPDDSAASTAPRRSTPVAALVARLLVLAAVALWLASLPSIRDASPSPYGLLAAASPVFMLAAALPVIAFCLAVRAGRLGDAVAAFAAWLLVVRFTPSIVTAEPIYAWTYKHLGVTDYLQQHGHVASGVDVYSGWPGLFSGFAWFGSLTGVSQVAIAHWFTPAVHVALAFGVYALCRAARLDRPAALVGAFVADAVNWVGQDYYSPQALALCLALPLLALLLHARRSPVLAWVSVLLFAAITVTHQLTPYWLLGVAVLLGLVGFTRPRWIGAVFAAIALGYLGLNLDIAAKVGLFSGFDPLSNAQSNAGTNGSPGQVFTVAFMRLPAVLLWGGALVLGVVEFRRRRRIRRRISATRAAVAEALSDLQATLREGRLDTAEVQRAQQALTGAERGWRQAKSRAALLVGGWAAARGRAGTWVPVILAFTSFTLLAGQNYGGEAIFRVFLYSIAGCAVLFAPVLTRLLCGAALRAVAGVGVVLLLALTSLQAYYGLWFNDVITPAALHTEQRLLSELPPNAVILGLGNGLPSRATGRYVDFVAHQGNFDAGLEALPGLDAATAPAGRVVQVLQRTAAGQPGPVYLVVTPTSRYYVRYYGVFAPGVVARVEHAMRTDGDWLVMVDTPQVTVYSYNGPRR